MKKVFAQNFKKNLRKISNNICSLRGLLYLGLAILTVFFVYINAPFIYEDDIPQSFGFFSDPISSSHGLKYDKCKLESMDNSVTDEGDFYFGCISSQFNKFPPDKPKDPNFPNYVLWGNCNHVIKFDNSLLTNNIPDYLIQFPFEIKKWGRSCRGRWNYEKQKYEMVELINFKSDHFDDRKNTIIVEWGEPPALGEFRVSTGPIFKRISYDEFSLNYYVTDTWLDRSDWMNQTKMTLLNNPPESFIIDVSIPKSYVIKDMESYDFSDGISKHKGSEKYWRIKADLIESNNFHLMLIPAKTATYSENNFTT
ncbi:MAG: hypothetical protein ABIF87_02370 [Pseudomonadota bacterium]